MPVSKKTGYNSYTGRPRQKTSKRITMPQIPNRPLRFQIRSLLRHEFIEPKNPWWMVVHRRGLHQDRVGQNQLEARAIPKGQIKGYVDERILYATLVNLFHFVPGVDFDYQSSLEGGRMEMGGLVADFLFRNMRIVLNPLGPQHYEYRNTKKDEEQIQILAEMGYTCYMFDQSVILDEYKLEEYLRRIFGGMSSGGDSGGNEAGTYSSAEVEANNIQGLSDTVGDLQNLFSMI